MNARRLALLLVFLNSVLFGASVLRWRALHDAWELWDLRVAAQKAMDRHIEEAIRNGELE